MLISSVACKTTFSRIHHLGFEEFNELEKSVGYIKSYESGGHGTGFVIAVHGTTAYILTNAHVYDMCKEDPKGCTFHINLPRQQFSIIPSKDKKKKDIVYNDASNSLVSLDYDFALFEAEIKKDELIPLTLHEALDIEKGPVASYIIGYPGGVARVADVNDEKYIFVRSTGAAWKVLQSYSPPNSPPIRNQNSLLSTAHVRGGSSGSPLLGICENGETPAIGIAYAGFGERPDITINVESLRSASRDNMNLISNNWPLALFKQRYPDLNIWNHALLTNCKLITTKPILKSLKIRSTVTNLLNETTEFIEVNGVENNQSNFFINGVHTNFLENFKWTKSGLSFTRPKLESGSDTPVIIMEKKNQQGIVNHISFCYRPREYKKIGDSMNFECFAKPDYTYFAKDFSNTE